MEKKLTITITEEENEDTLYHFLKDWKDLIEASRNAEGTKPSDGFYLKDMDQSEPFVQKLREEFTKLGFDPDKVILTIPKPDPYADDEDPTTFNMVGEYCVMGGE